jgi:hypothetical protein
MDICSCRLREVEASWGLFCGSWGARATPGPRFGARAAGSFQLACSGRLAYAPPGSVRTQGSAFGYKGDIGACDWLAAFRFLFRSFRCRLCRWCSCWVYSLIFPNPQKYLFVSEASYLDRTWRNQHFLNKALVAARLVRKPVAKSMPPSVASRIPSVVASGWGSKTMRLRLARPPSTTSSVVLALGSKVQALRHGWLRHGLLLPTPRICRERFAHRCQI